MEVLASGSCVRTFHCGPVVMELTTADVGWMAQLESELAQFDAVWERVAVQLSLRVVEERRASAQVKGIICGASGMGWIGWERD